MRRMMARLAVSLSLFTASVAAGETRPAMQETALAVSGMLCSSCSATVEKALKKLDGVAAAHADIRTDRVSVRYDAARVTPRQMVEVLRKAGYQARCPEPPAPPARARQR